ncbi:ScbR family autoregulator-binding transcription factor [Kitasatospora sp. HPMI-4]|uniref:ScbR family autoregulator-binding transcription factor n=1 Tax=Kitasatospora sp. HPMI-4 TaxID=3448443 RepID=UPI003F1CCB11
MAGRTRGTTAVLETFASDRGGAGLKQTRAIQTRVQVLNAAAELFAEQGFSSATLQDIAERAGVTKGAVYFHFPSKEAVANAVGDEFYSRWLRLADELRALDAGPLEALAEFLLRSAAMFRNDLVIKAGARLQIERTFVGLDLPRPFVGNMELIQRFLVEAQKCGELSAEADIEAMTRVLISASFGAQHICWVLNDRAELDAWVRDILRLVPLRSG